MPSTRDLLSDPLRLIGRVAAQTPLRLAFFACLSFGATWPLLEHAAQINEFRDAQVLQHYEAVAASSIRAFGQLPLWDPYYCGGMYLLGTPQARFVSPSFLLTLLFGESTGAALTAFGMLILGLEGAFRYARARGALAIGAALAAPIFGLSGVFANAAALAWTNFYGFALVPWIVLGFRRALRFEARGVAIAAVGVAWCVGFGGTYAVPLAAVWCGLEVLEVLAFGIARRRWRRTLDAMGMAVLTASLAAGLAAVRLWPVAETMITAPRVVGGTPGTDLSAVLGMLFLFPKSETQNAGFYIGFFALPPFLLALRLRRSWPLLGYGVLWAWLAPGYAIGSGSLFAAMVRLPVFGMLRYPERYLILLALVVSVLAAHGVSFALVLARRGRRRLTALVTCVVMAAGLLAGTGPMVAQLRGAAAGRDLAPTPLTIARPFHQARGSRWALAQYAPMQRGSLSCWDAYPVPESPLLKGDLQEEEYLQNPTAGRITERLWTPNRIDLDLDLDRPTRVIVNQNWHRGWRASEGVVKNERGLLEVEEPAGKRTLSLRFAPRSATGGALVSLASLAALLFFARRNSPRPLLGAGLAAAIVPPLAFAVALALLPEARVEASPPLAPTGEEIVRDELVEGTVPLDTVLGGGIALVAATVDNPMPAAGETVHLELDWRRDPVIDEGLGIFVHIEPAKGDRLNGDHFDLSQALSFEAAPPGKLLRDIVPITMPADSSGKRWKIWVGLWRLRRGGGRVPVIRNGSAIVDGNRILAGVVDVR